VRWYEIEARHFKDVKVIETYPRMIWQRMGLPGVPKEYNKIRQQVCEAVSSKTGVTCAALSHHQLDSVLCAFTALCYSRGEVEWFGEDGEGLIIIPTPGRPGRPDPETELIKPPFRHFRCMREDFATT
jgi:predicted nuclease with RNAse H fold